MLLHSTITCPHCAAVKTEIMPIDACTEPALWTTIAQVNAPSGFRSRKFAPPFGPLDLVGCASSVHDGTLLGGARGFQRTEHHATCIAIAGNVIFEDLPSLIGCG